MSSKDSDAEAGRRLRAVLEEDLERRAAALAGTVQEQVERRAAAAEVAARLVRDDLAAVQRELVSVRREALAAGGGAEEAAATARRALERGGAATTVTQVANEYGFGELGRFAVRYRQLFGETPSATLRRSAGFLRHGPARCGPPMAAEGRPATFRCPA